MYGTSVHRFVCVFCVCGIEPVPLWEQVRLKGPQYYLLHAMKLAFDLNLTSSIERARRWGSDLVWGSRGGHVCGDSPEWHDPGPHGYHGSNLELVKLIGQLLKNEWDMLSKNYL